MFKRIEYAIGRSGSRLIRIANFLRFFRIGMQNRYPICCVINFAWDRVMHKPPCARMRGSITIRPDKVYVPCKFHMRRHPTWKPWNGKSRSQLRLFSDKIGRP